jgi:dynactin complex subunit
LLVQSYHENGDVEDIVVTCKKVMEPKEISLHFLLHLNEDFDDDLLQDAIELLH